jgi:hypothetical protein
MFATASSPILACRSRTVSASTSGALLEAPFSKTPDAPSNRAFFHWWISVGWTADRAANSATVCSPFSAPNDTFALNVAACRFLFAISSVSFSKTRMTSNRSFRQCPVFGEHLNPRCIRAT